MWVDMPTVFVFMCFKVNGHSETYCFKLALGVPILEYSINWISSCVTFGSWLSLDQMCAIAFWCLQITLNKSWQQSFSRNSYGTDQWIIMELKAASGHEILWPNGSEGVNE